MQNISKEDYLGVIYKYRNKEGEIKANMIAEKLLVTNAAVTDMLRRLEKDGYIVYEKYKLISLTPAGEIYAKNMVRRHRIWELFLQQKIGMPWDKVHDEAHRLEHSSSDELIDRMEEILDFPEYDPHGDPIPDRKGKLPKLKKYISLVSLVKGETGQVVRVSDNEEKLLVYLTHLGIELNEVLNVIEKRDYDNSMLISVKGKRCDISEKIAGNIFVEKLK